MERAAGLSKQGNEVRDAELPAPRTMAELFAFARTAEHLHELTAAFARMLAYDGFTAHCCVAVAEDGVTTPLFGDARTLPDASRPLAPDAVVIPVESWHEDALSLYIFGRRGGIDAALDARLRGNAEVYATYGIALLERERDIPTASGLGLIQRQCLAQLLIGRKDPEIAETLGLTPLAVSGHINQAMQRLSATTRAQAVSIAARHGWLAGLEPGTRALLEFH